jgi:hypothetical protein
MGGRMGGEKIERSGNFPAPIKGVVDWRTDRDYPTHCAPRPSGPPESRTLCAPGRTWARPRGLTRASHAMHPLPGVIP